MLHVSVIDQTFELFGKSPNLNLSGGQCANFPAIRYISPVLSCTNAHCQQLTYTYLDGVHRDDLSIEPPCQLQREVCLAHRSCACNHQDCKDGLSRVHAARWLCTHTYCLEKCLLGSQGPTLWSDFRTVRCTFMGSLMSLGHFKQISNTPG